jgi:hypothetical protein
MRGIKGVLTELNIQIIRKTVEQLERWKMVKHFKSKDVRFTERFLDI